MYQVWAVPGKTLERALPLGLGMKCHRPGLCGVPVFRYNENPAPSTPFMPSSSHVPTPPFVRNWEGLPELAMDLSNLRQSAIEELLVLVKDECPTLDDAKARLVAAGWTEPLGRRSVAARLKGKKFHGDTALLFAIRHGLFATVPHLLKRGYSAVATDNHNNNALCVALLNNQTPAWLLYLLQLQGVRSNDRNFRGRTPLLESLAHPDLPLPSPHLVETAIGLGAFVNSRDTDGVTPLFRAAARPDSLPLLSVLLHCGAIAGLKNKQDQHQTVLHVFPGPERVELAELLLAHGLDLESKDAAGNTVMHLPRDLPAPADWIDWITQKAPGLFHIRNAAGHTPLYRAVAEKQVLYLAGLLEANPDIDLSDHANGVNGVTVEDHARRLQRDFGMPGPFHVLEAFLSRRHLDARIAGARTLPAAPPSHRL